VTSDRFPALPQHATVRVAGIVTARQRPSTAKGYVFVLMEDEAGPINVILKPDIYARDRAAVRMEPFLVVRGRLQKDGATMNVIAFQVEPLRVQALQGAEGEAAPSLPDTTEWWSDRARRPAGSEADPFRYLTALRQSSPDVKSFG
jgi:DNA polymerase III alpha subunit